ncbi:MAG: T9SS type A sorting domain-containing protein [Bacteroidetes bacterium]|nr:T9SS type A sorting domain-containing protein [Bacteroidota bacterium]
MKKPKLFLFWMITAFLMLSSSISSLAQNPTYICSLRNDVQVSQTEYQFDVYIQRTGPTVFKLAQFQMGINVNPAIKNGGTITVTSVIGTSTLTNTGQVPDDTKFSFNDTKNCIIVTPVSPPGAANASIISNVAPGTCFIRIRVSNSVPFGTAQPNLTWSFALANGYQTKMFAYVGSTNTDVTVQASHITSPLVNPILNPPLPPTAYAVTGGGAYCQGTTGLPVGLANSEIGTTYTLIKDGNPTAVTHAGTGSAFNFTPNQFFGTYTVSGQNAIGTTAMTGSAVITETPSAPVSVAIVADALSVCAGATVNFTATPTNGGAAPTYQWYVNAAPVGTGLTTFSYVPANNDQISVVMTSNLPGCLMNNPATSNIITEAVSVPGPAGVSIAASANPSCGTNTVTFTATPVNGGTPSYQWYLNGNPVGSSLPTYTYTPTTGDQVYVVMTSSLLCATANPATSNIVTMTVNVPVPVSVTMSPSTNNVCSGTLVTFTATPTNGGTPSYQWYKNGNPVGTNQATYAYAPANNDQVYVVMTSSIGCTTGNPATSATSTMTIFALPTPTLAGPATICATTTGNVYTTEAGFSNYVWTVSAGGSITSGGTNSSNTVTVTWNTAGAQTVSVNYTNPNNCTAVSPTVYNVTVNALPAPTLTGPATICAGTASNVYTTQAGNTNYVWSVSAGGSVTAGGTATSNTVTVTWNTPGPQTVSVNYTNSNSCTAAAPTVYPVTVNALPVPTISGSASVCLNSTGNIYTTEAGMTSYVWNVVGGTVTAGGTATSNTVTVTWTSTGAKTVSVNYTNANSCTAVTATVYNVTVNPLPVPTITGPATVCASSTGNVYTTQAGMSGYNWAVSAGGNITAGAGTSSITVTWNTAGAQTVSVNYINGNGCTAASATVNNVTVNALPVPTITGPTPVGVGSTQVYTTQTGMTNYVWSVSANGTITAGGTATSSSVTVLWNTAGAGTVSVNYTNANSCSALAPVSFPVTVLSVPPPAGTITGPTSVCQGATGVQFTVPAIPNATGYVWTLPVGATIATGANTNTITVNFSYTAVSGVITVYGTNQYGNGGPSPNFAITVLPSPVPTITGDNDLCQSSDYYYYSTEPGMTNYVWNISPNSGTITWVTGSNQVMIFWNSPGAHWVSVSYTNGSGCTAGTPTVYNVTVHPLPGAAGTISGNAHVCAGTNGVTYSIASVTNATSYTWTVPNGATIASGATSNTITVNFSSTAVSGNIIVTPVNACGNGPASAPFAVTIDPVPAAAGAITGPAAICEGTQGVVYTVGTITNATGYSWTVPAGATIVSGGNTNSITVNFGVPGSGVITVNGTNSCGNGVSSSMNVVVNPIPATPVITLSGYTLTSSAAVGNQWYRNGEIIVGATGQSYTAPNTAYYYVVVTINGCSSDTSNNIQVLYEGISELNVQKVSVYPNPNNGRFTLSVTTAAKENFDLRILNNLGISVFEEKNLVIDGKLNEVIDLKHLPNGVYSVILNNSDKQIIRKIVIE